MSARRALTLTVVVCVLGAALALLAAGRTWTVVTEVRPAPLPPLREARTGSAVLPWLSALGLVALAGAGALLATRGHGRTAVGVLLMVCGVAMTVSAGAYLAHGAWPAAAAAGGLAVGAAGAVAALRGRGWPGMGARYDRPAPAKTGTPTELWDALDRGDDPTARR